MKPLSTLLIANRGEIAVRIMRTAKAMGIKTVAVFAEADRHALHVASADVALFLGSGTVADTYLNKAKLLAAMAQSGADAVHPGYGFLSEDADFAEQVVKAGVQWVGPPPAAMRAMASKAAAKQTLEPKGVPMIPGYHGDDQSDATLTKQAQNIGVPLLVKASAGGGGKGMRVVEDLTQLDDAFAAARREAKSAFGDDRLLLEKFLLQPRHIEVQIIADQHGNVMSLFERDCSLQRRHQKVLEEAPAPNLPEPVRQAMWQAAETAAREIGYVSAGTVEFIYSATGEFFFLEMNTRLQVEHPVTEYIAGVDLVEWQLRIARGETLAIEKPAAPIGHAIEVRLYAEDPEQDFRPTVGQLAHLQFPEGSGIRVDTGVREGDRVSPFYDPMLAKIIVHAESRSQALGKLRATLAQCHVLGMRSNLSFLRTLAALPELADLNIHTRWIDQNVERWQLASHPQLPVWAALAESARSLQQASAELWQCYSGWRMDGSQQWLWSLSEQHYLRVTKRGDQWQVDDGEQIFECSHVELNQHTLQGEVNNQRLRWHCWLNDNEVWLDDGQRIDTLSWWQAEQAHDEATAGSGLFKAVMPGTVTAVHVKVGDSVAVGAKLISIEAMKMETTLLADVAGTVSELPWQTAQQVGEGDLLVRIEANETEAIE